MASLISSIIGGGQQSDADAQANATKAAALAALQNIDVPTVGEQELQLALQQNAGQLSPEQEGTVKLQGNALNNITTDPRLAAAQMGALQSLQQQGTEGLSASDKAALQQTENQLTQQANSQNQGTLQQFAQRGQAGSGASLAAQLMNNQNASNTANQRALQIAGQSQQNALQATAAAGTLGQNMQQQQYGQAANAANATNAINQFNAANSQNVMGTNTQAANHAQAYNLQNAQNISNQNTSTQNQQQQYNKGLYQQQFFDQLAKGQAAAGESNSLAGSQANAGADANKNTQAIGAGANSAVSQAATLFYNGGMVKGYDDGGTVTPGPSFGDKLKAFAAAGMPQSAPQAPAQNTPAAQPDGLAALISKLKPKSNTISMPNGTVAGNDNNYGASQLQMPQIGAQTPPAPSLLNKGGMAKPPKPDDPMSAFRMLFNGGEATNYKEGGKVPGKAKVKGDSPANDTVDAKLSPGELVIPRSIIGQPDNVIMDFVRAAKKHAKGGK